MAGQGPPYCFAWPQLINQLVGCNELMRIAPTPRPAAASPLPRAKTLRVTRGEAGSVRCANMNRAQGCSVFGVFGLWAAFTLSSRNLRQQISGISRKAPGHCGTRLRVKPGAIGDVNSPELGSWAGEARPEPASPKALSAGQG